jgi:hypothetical protein
MPVYGNLTTTTGAAGGPSTILLKVLQEYDRQLPLDFVAMILGRTRSEIEQEVEGPSGREWRSASATRSLVR